MGVFVIAEAATTWRYGDELATAEQSIKAAAGCGASAWKTQWTSDPVAMAKRRSVTTDYSRLAWPAEWLPRLKAMCDEAGIKFMCTCFIPQDADELASHCKRGKISAFECEDDELISVCGARFEGLIISVNPRKRMPRVDGVREDEWSLLHCISRYPTPVDEIELKYLGNWTSSDLKTGYRVYAGLSDHTTSTLTGAVAVGCGATIIEKHVKLGPLGPSDPDYGHSLWLNAGRDNIRTHPTQSVFWEYVQNIREAERML